MQLFYNLFAVLSLLFQTLLALFEVVDYGILSKNAMRLVQVISRL
jgi:hypothetical protein